MKQRLIIDKDNIRVKKIKHDIFYEYRKIYFQKLLYKSYALHRKHYQPY